MRFFSMSEETERGGQLDTYFFRDRFFQNTTNENVSLSRKDVRENIFNYMITFLKHLELCSFFSNGFGKTHVAACLQSHINSPVLNSQLEIRSRSAKQRLLYVFSG